MEQGYMRGVNFVKLEKAKKRDKKRSKRRHGMRTSGHSLKMLERLAYERAERILERKRSKND